MAGSLSLSAYLALRRGGGDGGGVPPPVRPATDAGEPLIWAHCPRPELLPAVGVIAETLAADGLRARIVASVPDLPANAPRPAGLTVVPAPAEFRAPVRAFLDALRPDLLIWMEGALRPVLLTGTDDRGIGRILVDARGEAIGIDGGAWLPGITTALLGRFDAALAVDHLSGQRLLRAGMAEDRVTVGGALEVVPRPPGCNERERRDLAQTIGPRPVWLAADLPPEELDEVIAAHRQAARAAHRLLCIVAPARAEDLGAFATALREAGLSVASRWDGAEPDPATEVYLADGPSEMGLWFRLSPITYMGGTLGTLAQRHPFEAAALGTAILHGGRTAPHAEAFARLTRAGAARPVRSGQNLGHAVEALLAPDRCAEMARAAWDVVTAGAVVSGRVADMVRAHLPAGAA